VDREEAFLRAICEEPDDDAHRLIYADWLDERGQATAMTSAVFSRRHCRRGPQAVLSSSIDPGRNNGKRGIMPLSGLAREAFPLAVSMLLAQRTR